MESSGEELIMKASRHVFSQETTPSLRTTDTNSSSIIVRPLCQGTTILDLHFFWFGANSALHVGHNNQYVEDLLFYLYESTQLYYYAFASFGTKSPNSMNSDTK